MMNILKPIKNYKCHSLYKNIRFSHSISNSIKKFTHFNTISSTRNIKKIKFHKLNGSKKTPAQNQSKTKTKLEDTSSEIIKETEMTDETIITEENIENKELKQDTSTLVTISDASSINETETSVKQDKIDTKEKSGKFYQVWNQINTYKPNMISGYARTGILLFLGTTFIIAIFRTMNKYFSPKATRKRIVNKNRELIDELIKYLPDKRHEITSKTIWMLRMKTGFSSMEIFRKYLWYVLRERKFDQDAVDDLIYLKDILQMSELDVITAINERATRVYEKYGSLMLNTEGMTSAGIERKATCRALFSKILYLSENESLINPESEVKNQLNLRDIFGATEDDIEKLRIISLQEIDLNELDKMASTKEEPESSLTEET